MLHAYRLIYPPTQHAHPQSWEYEQPYIDNLLRNTRKFDRWVVQYYFEDWPALDRDNTRIWNAYYRPKPLFDHLPTWQEWLPEYRQLISEVQDMIEEHKAQGTWRRPAQRLGYPKDDSCHSVSNPTFPTEPFLMPFVLPSSDRPKH